ncbi:hypothetical protein LN042_31055 [Kitasatospora sp. RB6PN24]|uniref:hypothetical protein n=1 Tax=Kitasatospora humi TaxID=2893891 RepID=UPI001E636039|nr:hypothetical protein [Kitasatospora humi]MCC9311451.1 hypothetical protein [Kitasatospora humi]
MIATPSAEPFDQATALCELRSLGRTLDLQVTKGTGATDDEVEATLRRMKQVHTEIVTGGSPAD